MVPRASPSSLISPPPPPLPPPTPAEDAAEAGELAAGGIGTLNVAPRSRSLRGGACTVCAEAPAVAVHPPPSCRLPRRSPSPSPPSRGAAPCSSSS